MKPIVTSALLFVVAAALVSVAVLVVVSHGSAKPNSTPTNVSSAGPNQVIEISAKGGYRPQNSTAKAGTPTTLKLETSGTFDCSSGLSIPKLGYHTQLPSSGETVVNVPPQQAGSTLTGVCSMGMYSFTIRFE